MDFDLEFATALKEQDKFTALRQTIIRFRTQGADKPALVSALENFRQYTTDEADEDIVLEVMDCLVGYCSAHMRID